MASSLEVLGRYVHTRVCACIYNLCKWYCIILPFSYFSNWHCFLRSIQVVICTYAPLLPNNSEGQPRLLLSLLQGTCSKQPCRFPIVHVLEFFWVLVCVRACACTHVCARIICMSSLELLSKKALPIYTPIGHVWGILYSTFLPLIGITQLCSFCQSKGVKCYLVLICISLTTNEFEPYFMCLLAFGVSFSVNCLSYHLPIFLLELMSSSCCFTEFLVDSRC